MFASLNSLCPLKYKLGYHVHRRVFSTSLSFKMFSLNDFNQSGPDLFEKLTIIPS